MIEKTTKNGVLQITIDRQDKANSLTEAMLQEISDAIETASGDTRALVLSAKGKVFSAGADLQEVKSGLAVSPAWEQLSSTIAAFEGLSVAALNGTLAGGAFGMVLACDLRVAVDGAKFFYPVVKMGVLPQPSDPGRLAKLVGPARAKMLLVAGQKIDAETALGWGLVDQVCAADDLPAVVSDLIEPALQAQPDHVARIKRMVP